MDYLPPGYIRRIGDERFPRFVIRDGIGQYWAARTTGGATSHADALLFYYGDRRNGGENRYCLGGDAADTFTATVTVTVHARRWSTRNSPHS